MAAQAHLEFTTGEPLCADKAYDPDWWFDYTMNRSAIKHSYLSIYAKHLCGECPVMKECRAYAMQFSNLYGVWGGTDHIERSGMQRAKGIKPLDFTLSFPSPIQTNRDLGHGRIHVSEYE